MSNKMIPFRLIRSINLPYQIYIGQDLFMDDVIVGKVKSINSVKTNGVTVEILGRYKPSDNSLQNT